MAPQPQARGPLGAGRPTPVVRRFDGLAAAARRHPLDATAEARLLDRAARGDSSAIESLVDGNADIVMDAARSIVAEGEGLSLDELVHEGVLGLVAAVGTYDPLGSEAFREHAAVAVRGQVEGAQAAEQESVRAARRLVDDAELYERAEVSIRREKGREATPAELAEKLEWTEERTLLLAGIVAEARRRHDEELLHYIDPEDLA